jgi:hypothetical protein
VGMRDARVRVWGFDWVGERCVGHRVEKGSIAAMEMFLEYLGGKKDITVCRELSS